MNSTALTAATRTDALAKMSDEAGLDVLVIGGGVTGAGIALDAATRGLRTGLVEAQDWASGTSSRSSKLVHGGLRYLQMLDFKLVHEALVERDLLTSTLAPHLVKPVAFLYPLITPAWDRFYVNSGVSMYDALASMTSRKRAMPWHSNISKKGLRKVFPALKESAAVGAVKYWDAQVDDARLVLSLVRTAANYGALVAPRTQVVELTKSGGRVTGAVVQDLQSGEQYTIKARSVINATGVWTEETESLSGSEGGLKVLASKGIHIVVPRERIQGDVGLILQTEKSVLFVIPWPDYWIIGTTDTPWNEDVTNPVPTATDIDYVLEHANAVLADPLTRDDIIGTYAGLRPLLQPGTKEGTSSAKVSREHTVASPVPGLVAIAGGKLTTYRVMAKDAVDFALGAAAAANPSVTESIPLIGATGFEAIKKQGPAIGREHGWTRATVEHLLTRYGSQVPELLALIAEQPDLAKPLANAPEYLRVEVAFAAHNEQVMHLEDVLMHRLRLDYEKPDHGDSAADEILEIISPILGWDAKRQSEERTSYSERVAAYGDATRTRTDSEAAAARAEAPSIAPMRSIAEPA